MDKGRPLIFDAMEKDVASSDHLGSTAPLQWKDICSYDGTLKYNVDILDKKNKKVGNLVFKTTFTWQEYIPPKPSDKLDKKSMLLVVIKEASFKKDADTFGKQDPYIKFKYQGVTCQTDVKDDAGKFAKWDETFQLP